MCLGCWTSDCSTYYFFLTLFVSIFFFFSSRRRHTRCLSDWSSYVCSSDLEHTSELQSLRHLVCRLLLGVQTCALYRKSTRLHSSHLGNSYAVFCFSKKTGQTTLPSFHCAP